MRRPGVVLKIEGMYAQIKMEKGTSCGERGCPWNASWVDESNGDFYVLKARNEVGASVGDVVLVEIRDSIVLAVAFLLYLFPIGGALLAYFGLRSLWSSSVVLTLGVLGTLLVCGIFIRWVDRSFFPDYRIVEFLDSENCGLCPLRERET
ncbi:MAG: SoxR reducing system RseC family protein [Candidatus Caldatribacteriaceae bacterium]